MESSRNLDAMEEAKIESQQIEEQVGEAELSDAVPMNSNSAPSIVEDDAVPSDESDVKPDEEQNDQNVVKTEGDTGYVVQDLKAHEVAMPHRATDFIGRDISGISLDGRSFVVPMDHEFDDVSSINTAQYGFGSEMRIVGQAADTRGGIEYGGDYEGPIADNSERRKRSSPKKGDDKSVASSGSEDDEGCLPLWLRDAPRWLTVLLGFAIALLLGSVALIGVGAALAVNNNKAVVSPTPRPVFIPSPAPVTSTMPPVESPTEESSTSVPVETPTHDTTPTLQPTQSPTETQETNSPTGAPVSTSRPTMMPTSAPSESSVVSFYIIGGRFTGDTLAALPENLASLPNIDGSGTVMFHLGDWNSPFATYCSEESYQENVNLYKNSSVPVYFIPGDNEYNDCPNPQEAFSFWEEYILGFETEYWPAPTRWNISRQETEYSENFAFIYKEVLVIGINLVGGTVHDSQEWQDRQTANLMWIEEEYYRNEGKFSIMLVLAHASPAVQSNDAFFDPFYQRVQNEYNTNVVLVYRNLNGETWGLETPVEGIDNLMLVTVEGSVWPPMLMQIDAHNGTVDVEQSEWFREF